MRMRLSDFIEQAEAILAEHGDLALKIYHTDGSSAPLVTLCLADDLGHVALADQETSETLNL